MRIPAMAFLLGASILSGCATLSEEECRVANWYEVGYSDAANGYSSQRIADHREACAPVGVRVDFNAYLSGYQQGLQSYCTRQTGFKLGKNGSAFPSQCGGINTEEVEFGYARGSEIYALLDYRQNLLDLRREKLEQLKALDKQIAQHRKRLKEGQNQSPNTSSQEKQLKEMRAKLKSADKRIAEIRKKLASSEDRYQTQLYQELRGLEKQREFLSNEIQTKEKALFEARQRSAKNYSDQSKNQQYRELRAFEKLRDNLDGEIYSLDREIDDLSRRAQFMEAGFLHLR
ncbi:DUF2799 domain-containing protein [Thiomicrorhabdus sp.]|uniref:DUF2799 domain-containing protein n=1 Tax=Thiomicrorhabdus sp. TaxID=2039724 RepID=UPI0029C82F41|nr:DUF2799 domain-containing protein [Thiomicrorhabdus sp.]